VLIYCVRRLLLALLLVWAVASAAFVLTRIAPGDATFIDDVAQSADTREAARRRLGLDQPLAIQYGQWLWGAIRLEFGQSSLYARPVSDLVRERMVNTAILASAALILAGAIGVGLGFHTATHPGAASARVARAASVLFLSTPPLIGSLVLVLFAARTGWLPIGGMSSAATASWWERGIDLAWHLPVPALALALPLAATLERVQAESLAALLVQPFVGASRARGVTARQAVRRHAWPVSLGPVLGLFGLMIGTLFSGSFVVEVVTAWPGLGRLMVDALRARDLFLVAGTAAAGAACLAVGTLLGDIVHAAIDPRMREAG
jgi:peptide/nickel transport system permease protein